MNQLEELKLILREKDIPFFDDDTLQYYLNKNKNNIKETAYECLIIKSEDTSITLPGLSTGSSANYFRRLASKYRTNNSRVLGR